MALSEKELLATAGLDALVRVGGACQEGGRGLKVCGREPPAMRLVVWEVGCCMSGPACDVLAQFIAKALIARTGPPRNNANAFRCLSG